MTVLTARRRCRSTLSRPDIVSCGQKAAERVKKTTSVPETKKKEELPMKQPYENLEDHTTPTSLSTLPLRWIEAGETLLHEAPPPPPERRSGKP
jgi:hypothetical protein